MSHHDLTRWIEDADARQFGETAALNGYLVPAETHYVHLGDAVAHLGSWLRHEVSRESLASIGSHALSYLRRHDEH
jgi:hypothetical protein